MPRPVHFEIHASNPERVVGFYEQVFGWKIERWGEEPYWLIHTGDTYPGIDGGLVPRRGSAPTFGAPVDSFVNTMDVADLDATMATIVGAGGTVVRSKQPVPGVGWQAYFRDPDGNLFGALQPDDDVM